MSEQPFEIPENRVRLLFDDPSYSGLVVVCRLPPLGEVQAIAALGTHPEPFTAEDTDKLVDRFADALVSWNLNRGAYPVPATPDGVRSLDMIFVMQLIEAWLNATAQLVASQRTAEAELELPVDVS